MEILFKSFAGLYNYLTSNLAVYHRRMLYGFLVDVSNSKNRTRCSEDGGRRVNKRREASNIHQHAYIPSHAPSPRRNRLNLGNISRRYSPCLILKSASWTLPLPLHIRFSAAGPYTDVYSSNVSSSVGTTRQLAPMTQ